MKKRFTLQFPDQEEEDLIALVFINHLGRKKSKFLSNAVNNYLLDIEKIINDHIDDEVMIERLEEGLRGLYGENFDISPYLETSSSNTSLGKAIPKPKIKPPKSKKPVVNLDKVKKEITKNTPETKTNSVKADSDKEENLRSDDHKVLAKQGVSEAEPEDLETTENGSGESLSELERLRKELAEKEARLKEAENNRSNEPEESTEDDIEKMKLASSALDFFK